MSCEEWEYLRWNQAHCRDKKGSKSFVCTIQSCVAFWRRTAFASRTVNILKASFNQWLGKIISYAASNSSAKINMSCTRWVFCKSTPRALHPAHLTCGHHRARLCEPWLSSFRSAQAGKRWKKLTPETACETITLNAETPAPRSHLLRCCPNSVSADSKPSPSQAKWALWVWALWVLSLGPRIHVSRDTGAKPGVSMACSNGTHKKKKSAGPINDFHLPQLLKEIAGFKTN